MRGIVRPVTEGSAVPSATVPEHVAARLQAAMDRLPSLSGQPRTVEVLEGGLTNVNIKVTTPERKAVVRLSSSDR